MLNGGGGWTVDRSGESVERRDDQPQQHSPSTTIMADQESSKFLNYGTSISHRMLREQYDTRTFEFCVAKALGIPYHTAQFNSILPTELF